jgi:hypothetical protein
MSTKWINWVGASLVTLVLVGFAWCLQQPDASSSTRDEIPPVKYESFRRIEMPPGYKVLKDNDGNYAVKMPGGYVIGAGYRGTMRSRQEAIDRAWDQWDVTSQANMLEEHWRTQGYEEVEKPKE